MSRGSDGRPIPHAYSSAQSSNMAFIDAPSFRRRCLRRRLDLGQRAAGVGVLFAHLPIPFFPVGFQQICVT